MAGFSPELGRMMESVSVGVRDSSERRRVLEEGFGLCWKLEVRAKVWPERLLCVKIRDCG